MGKATNFKFCTHINVMNRNKSPLIISAKVALGIHRESSNLSSFRAPMHRVHRVVVFAVAQLFCSVCPCCLLSLS